MEPQSPAATISPSHSLKKDILAGLFVLLVSSAVFVVITRQWQTPLRLPRSYSSDYLVYLTWVETMIEEGSYLHNSRVGRPLGTDWRAFPTSDGWLNWQVIRGLALLNPEPAWVMNWFYWLTFPLVGLSAFAVARLLGLSRLIAVAFALLYDFIPYHLMRHEHVFMTAYYLVPWSLYACLQWRSTNTLIGKGNRQSLVFVLLAVLTGLGYVYYAYFACILMLVAGIARSVNDRCRQPLVLSAGWCAIVIGTLLATLIPEITCKLTTQKNPDAPQRSPAESELYAFKITQLLMPVPDHQLKPLAKIRAKYSGVSPLTNENETSSLGMVGSAGFLFLLFRFLFRRAGTAEQSEDLLSLFTVVIALLATIGGFASVINWTQATIGMTPWIRSYNRISIMLGFIVLLGLAARAEARWNTLRTARERIVFAVLTIAVVAWGIFDQTPRHVSANNAVNAEQFLSDEEYFPAIESQGSPGDFVFILGYRYYPECPIEPFTDYSHFRPYLHSKQLTFNYGALRGEANDLWFRMAASQPVPEMIDHLARMEALGLLVFRPSHKDGGKKIEAEAEALLGVKPFVSPDRQFAFFNLRARSERLKTETPAGQWEAAKLRMRQPLTPVWRKNFNPEWSLGDLSGMTRDFGREAEIRVTNTLDVPRQLELRFSVKVIHPEDEGDPRWLRISHNGQDDIEPVPRQGTAIVKTFTIPPGETVIKCTPAFEREHLAPGGRGSPCWMVMSKISWAEK